MPRPLDRFLEAQDANGTYRQALRELQHGSKRSHWMWFVFPQIAGLGRSSTAQFYAIADREEAETYAAHPMLGSRLAECTDAVLGWADRKSAEDIFGSVDAMKFRSSMTLFEAAAPDAGRFAEALDAFFAGGRDRATLQRL